MIQVDVDESLNLFKITYEGNVDWAQASASRIKVKKLLPKLKPDFVILADLTALKHMDVSCAPEVQAVMDMFQEKGVAKIIRVIPDPKKDIGFKLMSAFHYSDNVTIITCETLDQAQKKLSA